MSTFLRRAVFSSVVVILAAGFLLAQGTTGTISGVIRDDTGAVVPGVDVTVTETQTNIGRTALTNDQGRYLVRSLNPGLYEVRAQLQGFATGVRRGIQLAVGQEAIVEIVLSVGEITEEVVVTGDAPLVETRSAALAGVVSQEQITALPLNGRGFQDLIGLQAGAIQPMNAREDTSQGMGAKFTIAGARYSFNQFLVDGGEINDGRDNTPASIVGSLMGVDAVREFKVLTNNYSAEYGRTGGAVITVVTKSGTNEFHGSLYEFHRNSALDARNFFAAGKLPFKRNQFGAAMQGPIFRNRTFFMTNYEGLRQRLQIPGIFVTLTNEARRGILPGRSPITVNPQIRPYLDLYPQPSPGGRVFNNGTAEFLSGLKRPINEDYFIVRIDHQLSNAHALLGRFINDEGESLEPDATGLFEDVQQSQSRNLVVEDRMVVSPSIVGTASFQYNRPSFFGDGHPLRDISPKATVQTHPKFGSFGVAGLDSLGQGRLNTLRQHIFTLRNDWVWDKGRHGLKLGGLFRRLYYSQASERPETGGSWNFDSIEDFLLNRPAQLDIQLAAVDPERNIRQNLAGFYVQDDIQLKRLTLGLGLRYELVTIPHETNGKMANLRSLYDPKITIGDPLFENPSLKNFAPRLGLAWDPFGDGKSSVRTGFGISHAQVLPRTYEVTVYRMPPFESSAQVVAPPPVPLSATAWAGLAQIPLSQVILNVTDFNLSTPYMMNWHLTLQRELFRDTAINVSYVGSRGVHLVRKTDWNINFPYQLVNDRKFFPTGLRRRNPNFSSISYINTDGLSNYNGLLLGVTRRFREGLLFQANYSFSRSIDNASEIPENTYWGNSSRSQDPDDRNSLRGLSGFHVTHRFSANWSYSPGWGGGLKGVAAALAKDWQLNGILKLATGPPYSVELGFDRARTGERTGQRPNVAAGFSHNPVVGGVDAYFDVNAFELQPAGFYGVLGRNTMIGPGLMAADFSVGKQFLKGSLSEDFRVESRAEFFNLFNRANFRSPAGGNAVRAVSILNSRGERIASAARLTATTTPGRQIQFGLKILF
ncbi:MAG: TonB-dependent receptor [Acidobacteria bacterium]|nr:TonB-dependent receptor [Acidobacteriota bacterium]